MPICLEDEMYLGCKQLHLTLLDALNNYVLSNKKKYNLNHNQENEFKSVASSIVKSQETGKALELTLVITPGAVCK